LTFQRRFGDFLNLTRAVNTTVLATITRSYFELRWVPPSLSNYRNRFNALSVSAAKNIAMVSVDQCAQLKSDDTDSDYFWFTESTDPYASGSITVKYESEVFQFLKDSRKEIIMLNNNPLVKTLLMQFSTVPPSTPPEERLSSFAGIIRRPHRRNVCDKPFDQLLVLKEN
jgi:hypothetical protein